MAKNSLINGVQTGKTIWHKSVTTPDGNIFDLAQFNGQVVFPDGQIGTYAGVETIDLVTGKDSGHVITVLDDGSVSNQEVRGEVIFTNGKKHFRGKGVWEMVAGSGQFADLRGGGTYKWEMNGDNWRAEFSS